MFSPEEVPVEKAMDATCQTPAHRDPSTGTSHFTAATRLPAPALGLGGTALHLRGVAGFRGTMAPWLRPCEPPPSPPPPPVYTKSRGAEAVWGSALDTATRACALLPATVVTSHRSLQRPVHRPCAPRLPGPGTPFMGDLGPCSSAAARGRGSAGSGPLPPPTTSLFCSSQSPLSAFNV